MKSNLKRIQIDLSSKTVEALDEMATEHGHKLKPFIEYVLMLQAGIVPPPKVASVVIPSQGSAVMALPKQEEPKQEHKQRPISQEKALQVAKQVLADSGTEPQRETVKEADKEGVFIRRVGRWTNGKCYRKEDGNGQHVYSYV